MLLYERMLFRQAHNPLVNAYIMQPLNRWNDHARGNQYSRAPGPERTWTADTGVPLGPNLLLEMVPALLDG
jgi:hypothetical protein